MYIGIDLGGTTITLGLFIDSFEWVTTVDCLTESETNSTQVMANIFSCIKTLLLQGNCQAYEVKAMGIDIPGLMDMAQEVSFSRLILTSGKMFPLLTY